MEDFYFFWWHSGTQQLVDMAKSIRPDQTEQDSSEKASSLSITEALLASVPCTSSGVDRVVRHICIRRQSTDIRPRTRSRTTLGAAVASWLVRSSPGRAARVRALAGVIALCSWARHFTLTVPLSTQVYKWVPANLTLGVTLRWTSIPFRGE